MQLLGYSSGFFLVISAITLFLYLDPASRLPDARTGSDLQSPFQDVASAVGLVKPHISSRAKDVILDTIGGGIGFIDCDNDGLLDIIYVNGSTIEDLKNSHQSPMVTLYHQVPGFKFEDITQAAGLTRTGWGMGVSVADYDNDGFQDIYVTGYGHNALYHNLGNCRFEDATQKAGLTGGGFSAGAAWADYDRDGKVDLFVTKYVRLNIDNIPLPGSDPRYCTYFENPVHCGPQGMAPESDVLYHNRGDGTFEDVTSSAGLASSELHYGLGAVWGDYDNDGWPDLYVASDAGRNFLYHNMHDATFEEVGMAQGVALNNAGRIQGSMGVDWGDFDGDGRLDLLVTAFTLQSVKLYHNLGSFGFADVGSISHIAQPSAPYIGWGAGFADLSNSGWLDIVVANGHVYPQADSVRGSAPYMQPLLLFHNLGSGHFEDLSELLNASPKSASWRGLALGDVNNDGCIDVALLNVDGPPSLLINHCPPSNHSVLIKLEGSASNRAAIGARVKIVSKSITRIGEVRGGGSYLSQGDQRLHFGLGSNNKIDSIDVKWPSGREDTLENLGVDYMYTIIEGKGLVRKRRLELNP